MIEVEMTVMHRKLAHGETLTLGSGHYAIGVLHGRLSVAGRPVANGQGGYARSGEVVLSDDQEPADFLLFSVGQLAGDQSPQLSARIRLQAGKCLLRLDQVTFPPGAIAYRHVHKGAGIRYLTRGRLDVRTDHGAQKITPGGAWFEDTNSPVMATSSPDEETAFVRAMLVQPELLGRPTITYLDEEDADKPRLQTNTRFFETAVEFLDQ